MIEISKRAGSQRWFIESTGTPVISVLDSLLEQRNLQYTRQCFPVTNEEIFDCVDFYLETKELSKSDFITFTVAKDENDVVDLTTSGITKWPFFSILSYGRIFNPKEERCKDIYASGLENIFKDILTDLYKNERDFLQSQIHELVYHSFIESYGELDATDIEYLLESLNVDFLGKSNDVA